MDISQLIEIAKDLNLNEILKELEALEDKVREGELNIVVLGEFNAGKSTLINRLFSINLPTDILPETATIWKIKNCNSSSIDIYFKNGDKKEVSSIDEVKLFNPKEIEIVEICIESDLDINIVDTPGLSSLDDFHKEALVEYLDEADVIIVAIDINQALTKSTKDFLEQNIYASQKTYIALTKSDTKSIEDIQAQKEYISQEYVGFEGIIVISKDDISELQKLLKEIAENKLAIIEARVNERANIYCKMIKSSINSMMDIDISDIKALKKKKIEVEDELDRILNLISQEEGIFYSKIDNISHNMTNFIIREISSQREWIVQALYDEDLNESIEDRLNSVVQDAITKSLYLLEEEIDKVANRIKDLSIEFEFDDIGIIIVDKIVRFREYIISGLTFIIAKIPQLRAVSPIFRELMSQTIEFLSKSFVLNKLDEALVEIEKILYKDIQDTIKSMAPELFRELIKDLNTEKKTYEELLNKLQMEISQKDAQNRDLLNSLKEKERLLNCKE